MICAKLKKQKIRNEKGRDLSMLIGTALEKIRDYLKTCNEIIKEIKSAKNDLIPE